MMAFETLSGRPTVLETELQNTRPRHQRSKPSSTNMGQGRVSAAKRGKTGDRKAPSARSGGPAFELSGGRHQSGCSAPGEPGRGDRDQRRGLSRTGRGGRGEEAVRKTKGEELEEGRIKGRGEGGLYVSAKAAGRAFPEWEGAKPGSPNT